MPSLDPFPAGLVSLLTDCMASLATLLARSASALCNPLLSPHSLPSFDTPPPYSLPSLHTPPSKDSAAAISAAAPAAAAAAAVAGGAGPSDVPPTAPLLAVAHSAYSALPTLQTSEKCMILLPVACYWIYSTILFILSWLRLTSVELHRIPTDQKMRPANRVTVSHVLQRVAVQHAIQIAVAYGLAVGMREDNMSTRPVEHPLLFVAKIVIASVMLDTYQYWMHRWMHTNRWLYRNFHSVHHELTVLYAFGALYNHPLEGLLMDTVGSGLPTLVLDMHPWTATAFFCIATLKTVDDHCGYALPWDPLQTLFRNNAVYHDIHHWGKGRMYNFSQPFFTFWDVWMGTDYEIAMQKQAAAKAQRSVANGDFSSAAVAAEPPMTTVTTTRRALSEPPDGGVARRRVVSKTLQVADDINPVTPPSPTLSCSDCSNDSAIGSSCGDWEAERAAEKACDDRNAPDIIESDPWRLPAATRT